MTVRKSNRRGKRAPPRGPAFNPDVPTEGCYKIKLVPDAPYSAVRFWLGPPIDPDTGEPMDRVARWQCRLNGVELVPIDRYWPRCAREPISLQEHDRLCALHRTQDPEHPFYDPRRPIDPLTTPLPFQEKSDG